MQVDITIKNYRCFPDTNPARLTIRDGFTALVGVNNSGKSSLLKFFYEFRSIFQRLGANGNFLGALRAGGDGFGVPREVTDINELFSRSNNRDLTITFEFPAATTGSVPNVSYCEIRVRRSSTQWYLKLKVPGRNIDERDYAFANRSQLRIQNGEVLADLSNLFEIGPILSNALYIGPFRNAINIGANSAYFDIQVGQSFIKQWKHYQTGKIRSQNEATYKLTENIKHIFGYSDLQINASDDEETLQILANGRSFGLSELGSGLTQFILVLANASVKQPSLIFIDEPELNLHPSLQLDFLTTLASYSSRGIVFATHNIGLARSSAQWIYSVIRQEEGTSTVHPYDSTPRLSEFLGELSFSGYKALGFSQVLLVEGSTDVTSIQQFLRLYGKDHKIVILPLGGSSMINGSSLAQLEEIKRITSDVTAIIDSEKNGNDAQLSADREAFRVNCAQAGIRCHILKRRALENYLADRAVKVIKGRDLRALEDYERLNPPVHGWSKIENWRIARDMTKEELNTTDLGDILGQL